MSYIKCKNTYSRGNGLIIKTTSGVAMKSAVIRHVIILISIRPQTIKKVKNVNHALYKTCLQQHIVFSFVTVCEHSNAPFHRHNYKARAAIDDG